MVPIYSLFVSAEESFGLSCDLQLYQLSIFNSFSESFSSTSQGLKVVQQMFNKKLNEHQLKGNITSVFQRYIKKCILDTGHKTKNTQK